jgi:hypothetical protein
VAYCFGQLIGWALWIAFCVLLVGAGYNLFSKVPGVAAGFNEWFPRLIIVMIVITVIYAIFVFTADWLPPWIGGNRKEDPDPQETYALGPAPLPIVQTASAKTKDENVEMAVANRQQHTAMQRLGHVLGWAGNLLGIPLILLGVYALTSGGDPSGIVLFLLLPGIVIFLLGRALRYIFAG